MSGIEFVVRPFETGSVTPSKVVPPATATTQPSTVHLRIGRDGSAKTFHGSYSLSDTKYVKKFPKETTVT